MSKLLVQSRTFLPMVVKKSPATEKLNILQTHPTISSSILKKETPENEIPIEKEQQKKERNNILSLQANIPLTNECTVKRFRKQTLIQALMLDVMQVQGWLAKMMAQVHMWVFRKEQGLLRGLTPSPTLVFLEGRPLVKEEVPDPILPEHHKTKPLKQTYPGNFTAKKGEVKTQKKSDTKSAPVKSNFVDSLLERTPEWQKSISANLGALQKKVVDKLPK